MHVAKVFEFFALCAVNGCLNVTSTLDVDVDVDVDADDVDADDGVGATGCLRALVFLLPTGLFNPGRYSPDVSVPNSSCKECKSTINIL